MTEPRTGATPNGLPYPESTDPANQGANAIKALALALDNRAPRRLEAAAVVVVVGASSGIFDVAFTAPFNTIPVVLANVFLYATYMPAIAIVSVSTSGFRGQVYNLDNQPFGPGTQIQVNFFASGN